MKIVHVGLNHRPDDIRIFQKECSSLARYGHQVIYVTSNMNGGYADTISSNVKVIIVDYPKTNGKILYLSGRRCRDKYYRKLRRVLCSLDADIYHFHESLFPVLNYMKRCGKLVIYDLHEDTPRQIWPRMYAKYGKIISGIYVGLFELYENYCIKKADYVITATPHIEERCKKITDKVKCVANYPIIRDFESGEKKVKEEKRKAILCYCGEISENRNVSMYIEMMRCIEGKLLLAGALDISYRKQLERISSWDKVESLGYLDREGVKNLYKKSDVGLCILKNTPNIYYSLPIKLFEYMEAGLPIICSDFPIWREIVEGCDCGIVVPYDDMEKAVEAAKYILEHPDVAMKMGENGKRAVKEKYNWGTEEKKLLEVYDTMEKRFFTEIERNTAL